MGISQTWKLKISCAMLKWLEPLRLRLGWTWRFSFTGYDKQSETDSMDAKRTSKRHVKKETSNLEAKKGGR